jgi:hypothetical protein
MAVWTAPTTRSLGELITPSIFNTDVVENLKYLKDLPSGLTKIDLQTLGGTVTQVDFSSISGAYNHLLLTYSVTGSAAGSALIFLRFNDDSTAIYDYIRVAAAGTTQTTSTFVAQTRVGTGVIVGSDANRVSAGHIWIYDYARTFDHKVLTAECAAMFGTTSTEQELDKFAGRWRSTAAITKISITEDSAGLDFGASSRFALYGVSI